MRDSSGTSFDQYSPPRSRLLCSSGDGGLGVRAIRQRHRTVALENHFNRDGNGNFTYEQYYTAAAGATLVPTVASQLSEWHCQHRRNFRGYPDVASDFCCTAIYLQGWGSVGVPVGRLLPLLVS